MPRIPFTAQKIRGLRPPESGQAEYWDTTTPGFGLRVFPSGRKSWMCMYRTSSGRQRRLSLGTYPVVKLADARVLASRKLRDATLGHDPADEKRAARRGMTFATMADEYLELHAKTKKRSWHKDERAIERDLKPAFRGKKAREVSRHDVIDVLDRIVARGAPVQANRVHEIARRLFAWGVNRGIVDSNPAIGIERQKEVSRDVVLSEAQIRGLWKGLDATAMETQSQIALKLILVTAQRPGEVCAMERGELDLDSATWTQPASKTKNGVANVVPLSDLAVDLVREACRFSDGSRYVFPSRRGDKPITTSSISQALRRNLKALKLVDLNGMAGAAPRPHDLRRSAASHMTRLGIPRLVVGKILNHVDRGVDAVYDRNRYDSEKRRAAEVWEARLLEIVEGKPVPGNVVAFQPVA